MVGNHWTEEEEKFFWNHVVPNSNRRLGADVANLQERSWGELGRIMHAEMTVLFAPEEAPRKQYSSACMSEHFWKNVIGGQISDHAGPYVKAYRALAEANGVSLEKRKNKKHKSSATVPADADESDHGGAKNAGDDNAEYDEEEEYDEEDEEPLPRPATVPRPGQSRAVVTGDNINVAVSPTVPASAPAVHLPESSFMLAPPSVPGLANHGGNAPVISADQEAFARRIETMLANMETRLLNINEARLVHHLDAREERMPGMIRAAVRQELNNQQNALNPAHRHPLPSTPDRPRQSGTQGSAGTAPANTKKRTRRQANAPAPFDPAVGLPTTLNVSGGAAPAGNMSDALAAQMGLVRRADPVRRHGYGDGLGGPVAGHFPSPPRRTVAPSARMMQYLDQQSVAPVVASGDSTITAEQPLDTNPAPIDEPVVPRPRADSQTTLVNGEPGAPIVVASDDDTDVEAEV